MLDSQANLKPDIFEKPKQRPALILKLIFQALALSQGQNTCFDKGLVLDMSALKLFVVAN